LRFPIYLEIVISFNKGELLMRKVLLSLTLLTVLSSGVFAMEGHGEDKRKSIPFLKIGAKKNRRKYMVIPSPRVSDSTEAPGPIKVPEITKDFLETHEAAFIAAFNNYQHRKNSIAPDQSGAYSPAWLNWQNDLWGLVLSSDLPLFESVDNVLTHLAQENVSIVKVHSDLIPLGWTSATQTKYQVIPTEKGINDFNNLVRGRNFTTGAVLMEIRLTNYAGYCL
jgi:hypothetical protein